MYLPEEDCVIFFDGPCHFLEHDHIKQRPESIEEIKNLTPYFLNTTKMNDKVVKHFHKRLIRFDYQLHDYLYLRTQLKTGLNDPEVIKYFRDKLEKELWPNKQ